MLRVDPAENGLVGTLGVPGDKSISHRAVMLGAIADGVTEVTNFLPGEDNISTINAFRLMGITIDQDGTTLKVHGKGLRGLSEPTDIIDAGNSGTTARLLLGLLSAQDFFTVITGDASLRTRPMGRVVEPLRLMGARIQGADETNRLPLAIVGKDVVLEGRYYPTPVPSAQLKSAILFAGLYAEGETSVKEVAKSRDHTERLLKLFGADIDFSDDSTTVTLRKTDKLTPCSIAVPGDPSSAAFFMVAAAIVPDSEVVLTNVGTNPTRAGIFNILIEKMGASGIKVNSTEEGASGEPVAEITVKSSSLKPAVINAKELLPAIDEFPIICVAAAFANGATKIMGAGELRVKECDRIAVMAKSLTAIGVKCEEEDEGIVVYGTGGKRVRGGRIDSHGDHRIAMALAVAGLMSEVGVTIDGADAVDVSFPGFFGALDGLRR
ncbi:MAG: 3-phosphoshikimate 1-carboxyvinyltransferase [Proteobacteria bacterium]|nr:3-phosphoshikimate 1-carboxyvinyltransferase [Pseudomonadota bacterium]